MFKRIVIAIVFAIALYIPAFAFAADDEGSASSAGGASVASTSSAPTDQKRGTFLDPVLKWQREFDPPLSEISAKNSGGEYIAVQAMGGTGKDKHRHGRILFLNSRGETIRTIELGKKEKRLIKTEDVWLTFDGGVKDDPDILRDFKSGKLITTVTAEAHVSGDGEYYGILTRDVESPESPWYEFAYYDRTGKLLWTSLPQMNYFSWKVHISFDGSRVLLIDQEVEDIFGQKWYLFDRGGRLLRTSTKDMPWIEDVDILPNGKFIAYGTREKIGLMDKDGIAIWEKKVERSRSVIFYNGMVKFFDKGRYKVYSLAGDIVLETPFKIDGFSSSGKYVLAREIGKEEGIRLLETSTGLMVTEINSEDIVGKEGLWLLWPMYVTDNYMYLVIGGGYSFTLFLFDVFEKKIVWEKKDIHSHMAFKHENGSFFLLETRDSSQIKKITVYDVSRGVGE